MSSDEGEQYPEPQARDRLREFVEATVETIRSRAVFRRSSECSSNRSM